MTFRRNRQQVPHFVGGLWVGATEAEWPNGALAKLSPPAPTMDATVLGSICCAMSAASYSLMIMECWWFGMVVIKPFNRYKQTMVVNLVTLNQVKVFIYQHSTSFATLHVKRDINRIIKPAVNRKTAINITCLFRLIAKQKNQAILIFIIW